MLEVDLRALLEALGMGKRQDVDGYVLGRHEMRDPYRERRSNDINEHDCRTI